MNENINLFEILKGHEGETFYNPIFFGDLIFIQLNYPYIKFKTNKDDIKLLVRQRSKISA